MSFNYYKIFTTIGAATVSSLLIQSEWRKEDKKQEERNKENDEKCRNYMSERDQLWREHDILERKEKERREIMIDTTEKYNKIRSLQKEAFEICYKVTKSDCDTEKDLIKLAEIYAEGKANKINIWSKIYQMSQITPEELKKLDDYRREFSNFYTNILDYNNLPRFPALNEFESFVTLHWTLATMNNIMKKSIRYPYSLDPPENRKYHSKVMDEISRRNEKRGKRIVVIQNIVKKEFHKIRKKYVK